MIRYRGTAVETYIVEEQTKTDASDRDLIEWLAQRNALCPACRYNLRQLQVNRCPECGIAFELGLKASMPGFRAWMFALIAATLGVGLAFLFTVGGMLDFLRFGWRSIEDFIVLAVCGASFAGGVVYIVMLVRRRARLWQGSARQSARYVGIAAVIAILPLMALAYIVLILM